ncbi:phosphatidate phosphatase App1 family protein [Paraliomyxa miuraensis]|uniref:phosphatidate phosphatase App1 family protein n=1 Tax=Paraliomyxa miuraensis TaxID=376150 RepID=UPI002253645D|nr:App1 family protein [Paraliomyxa miuraensis]MCX4242118.1 App1 family protein [Paraliomyxa miuraensis]
MLVPLAVLLCACSRGAEPGDSGGPAGVAAPPASTTPPKAAQVPLAEVEPSTLSRDETVAFLPTFAVVRDGHWKAPVDAWVYEPEEDGLGRKALIESMAELLELAPGSPDEQLVANNLRPFVVDNERGKWVALRRGAHAVRVGPTEPNGRASGSLEIPEGDPATVGEGAPPWVELEVVMPSGDPRRFSAWVQLLPDEGVSVISDIDDTIKITNVLDHQEMLANTFLRPWQAVPGMAAAYQRWAEQGVAFHYVSASPLPLLGALGELASREGFPRGSLALRPFRWTDGTALELLDPSESYKRAVIFAIMESFQHRGFVLVGDTGERDPEIYADVARRFPDRVRAIYLRDPVAGGTPSLAARLDVVFEGLPRPLWQVIADGGGLPEAPG